MTEQLQPVPGPHELSGPQEQPTYTGRGGASPGSEIKAEVTKVHRDARRAEVTQSESDKASQPSDKEQTPAESDRARFFELIDIRWLES